MNPLRRLLHGLAHRLHWQLGQVVSATDSRGRVWVGFECATCGQITGASIAWSCSPARDQRLVAGTMQVRCDECPAWVPVPPGELPPVLCPACAARAERDGPWNARSQA